MVWIGLPAPSCSRCLCPDGRTIRYDPETSEPNSGTEDLIPVNNPLERIMKEIRRRTRVVGAFPDGQSCLNLAAARLRYIAGTAWSAKCYMNMRPLYQPQVTQTEAVA
jgi:transposase-like protein